jgi:hypothetical protein
MEIKMMMMMMTGRILNRISAMKTDYRITFKKTVGQIMQSALKMRNG